MARKEVKQLTVEDLRQRYLQLKIGQLRKVLQEIPDERQRLLFRDPGLWKAPDQEATLEGMRA